MSDFFFVVILPAISLVSGILSLQIDPKSNKKWLLIAIMVLSAAGSVASTMKDNKDKASQDQIIDSINNLSGKIAATTNRTDMTVSNISALLSGFGNSQAVQALKADSVLQTLTGKVKDANLKSSPPVITYYPKDVDGPKVVQALESGGFRVTQGVGNLNISTLPTNAVWGGAPVTIEQAKFVALTLVRAGVGIRYIGRIEGASSANNVIQVGASAQHQGSPLLTVDQIQQLQSFM
jgi:hypothetical protein